MHFSIKDRFIFFCELFISLIEYLFALLRRGKQKESGCQLYNSLVKYSALFRVLPLFGANVSSHLKWRIKPKLNFTISKL